MVSAAAAVPLRVHHPRCVALLQACGSMAELLQLQAQMLRNGLFFDDPFAAGKMLEFCVRGAGNLYYARKLFEQMTTQDTFAWNTLIRGHAASPSPGPALRLFARMAAAAGGGTARPNSYTYTFVLKACAGLRAAEEGEQVHGSMTKLGVDREVFPANALISMYSACGKIELGRRMFDTCAAKDVVTWNAMVSGYLSCGLVHCARKLFEEMPDKGIVSWNAMINGYTDGGDVAAARELFDLMPQRDAETWNTMIAGYAKCGCLDAARELFERMPARNVVSWSTMISACAQGRRPGEALALFEQMQRQGVRPNWAAVVSLLSACACVGALDQGRRIHRHVERNKMKVDSILGTALIDMYAKCGCIDGAAEVFSSLPCKDVFSWTAMIGGMAVNGHGERALELFRRMLADGVRPNAVTFVGVLCACSHLGQAALARRYFDSMSAVHGIEPQAEHYGCLVDALGRAGRLEEAAALVEAAPAAATGRVLWATLLGACWIHGNVKIGEAAACRLAELDPDDGGAYVLLSNIYAAKGRWDDARRLRTHMRSRGLHKCPGRSSIEVSGATHEFYAGDRSHPRAEEIERMLEEMGSRLKLLGHAPNTSPVLFDIDEEEKEEAVSRHSERLAIAFGLLATAEGTPIRVVKNLRVCGDCHTVAKLVSRAFAREIILRDRNIFHHFRGGSCSCKDYW